MRPQEITAGRFYLKHDETDVRQVLNLSDGQIFWQGYDYRSGKPHGTFSCSVEYFAKWAGRELTRDEQRRMQSDLALETLHSEAAERVERALRTATTDQLRRELARREAVSSSLEDVDGS